MFIVAGGDLHFFLRIFNTCSINTLALFEGISHIFANIVCQKSSIDSVHGHNELLPSLPEVEDAVVINNQLRGRAHDWLSKRSAHHKDNGDEQAVFNALDTVLKDTLERLKNIRESIIVAGTSLWECKTESKFASYESMIRSLCLKGKVGAAFILRNRLLRKHVVADVCTHNYLINALCKISYLEDANRLIEEMSNVGPSPNCVTYNTLIDGYCRMDNLDRALYLFSIMGKNFVKPNRVTCNILVQALCKKELMDNGRKLLVEILGEDDDATSDIITSTIFIDGFCKKGDINQALRLWNEMSQKVGQMDVVAYNVLIHGLCLINNTKLACRYFSEMFKRGLYPDVFTYNTLISGFCREGNFDEACCIHSLMSTMGVQPDEISYKMVIQGLCLHGDISSAKKFLLNMLEHSGIPGPHIWNIFVDAYGRQCDRNHAFLIRDQMVASGVAANAFTYNALVKAEIRRGDIVGALSLKHEMFCNGLFPDVVTYNLLIGAYCNFGDVRSAFQLYDEMLRRGHVPDFITYTELIRGHCIKGNVQEAVEILTKMQRSDVVIDHVPFQILIKKFCNMREPEKAYKLYEEMFRRGLVSRLSTYFALISALSRKGLMQEATLVHNDMDSLGLMIG